MATVAVCREITSSAVVERGKNLPGNPNRLSAALKKLGS